MKLWRARKTKVNEYFVYGSKRLGIYTANTDLSSNTVQPLVKGQLGYELTDHLGNIRAVVSGKGVVGGVPTITMATDYYPFGMEMPQRSFSTNTYRFNYNGKEIDRETGLEDYGFRIYDPKVCRFLSVDPLTKKYPELTPYQFASNSPISGIDLDGLEYYYAADGKFLGQGSDKKSKEVLLGQMSGKNVIAVDLEGKPQKQWTILDRNINQFKYLAGVLYAEGSSTWKEAGAIYSVLENRAKLEKTSVVIQATTSKGVNGASEVDKINSKNADQTKVQNAYKGLIFGILSEKDLSNGAFFWDGKDFNGQNKNHGGYTARYKPGYKFTDESHDLYNQGDHLKSGKTLYGKWDYKYESTTVEGNTTFSKLTNEWRDAQFLGSKKANEMGGKP